VLKQYPGYGFYPWCVLCAKWSDFDHRRSRKHCEQVKSLRCNNMQFNAQRSPQQSPSAAPTAALAKPCPHLPTHPWTDTEWTLATELLKNPVTAFDFENTAGGIYNVCHAELKMPFRDFEENELVSEVRVLQLALMRWQTPRIETLKQSFKQSGKGCMNALIEAHDWMLPETAQSKMPCYVKSAGDMLQGYWVHLHLLDSRYHFSYNLCQAAFAKWMWLPRCMLGEDAGWSTHGMADFCEAATLYLPAKLMHTYLQCLANFHKLLWSHLGVPRCEHVGRIPCHKVAVNGTHFCGKHSES